MAEEFFDSKTYEQNIADSDTLKRLLRNRNFIAKQINQVMTMYGGEVSPLTLIRGLEYWLSENQEVSQAIERVYPSNAVRRRCLLHHYAIFVYAMAFELKIMEEFGSEQK